MDYMTLKEASEKWGVTPRWINYYCAAGRIPGAMKVATIWLIPKTSKKPIDGRTKKEREISMKRILLVEDDHNIVSSLTIFMKMKAIWLIVQMGNKLLYSK